MKAKLLFLEPKDFTNSEPIIVVENLKKAVSIPYVNITTNQSNKFQTFPQSENPCLLVYIVLVPYLQVVIEG